MTLVQLPKDANGVVVSALCLGQGENVGPDLTWTNETDSHIIRVVANNEAGAYISIHKVGVVPNSNSGAYLPLNHVEYIHIPIGYEVDVTGDQVNFIPCL